MDTVNKSRWQVRGAAIVIFLLGFTAGALALNAYKRWDRSGDTKTREARFDDMLDTLKLNADQKTQVGQILGDAKQQLQSLKKGAEPQVQEIRRQTDERLQKVLTPEQWKQFQQEREKMRSRNRRGRENSSNTP